MRTLLAGLDSGAWKIFSIFWGLSFPGAQFTAFRADGQIPRPLRRRVVESPPHYESAGPQMIAMQPVHRETVAAGLRGRIPRGRYRLRNA